MTDPLPIAAAVLSTAVLFLTLVSYARYRWTYRYAEEDLEQARSDAARRSRSALGGRRAEQLAPLVEPFSSRFDPADARFLGAPIDYLVFDGLAEGELREVVLVEVKAGSGRLSASERMVAEAVEEGRVGYEVVRL